MSAAGAGVHETFLNDKVILIPGDCLEKMRDIESNSVDSCVCDPPYHLVSGDQRSTKRASSDPAQRARVKKAELAEKEAGGFMGMKWDGGDIAFRPELWREVFRVLKPGAHIFAFGGTRTYHRMACAVEDAGFEIRDCAQWLYGTGFTKSVDVSKAIDEYFGAERKVIGLKTYGDGQTYQGGERSGRTGGGIMGEAAARPPSVLTEPATPEAKQWAGWGTAFKPACELIVVGRKPFSEKTIAANILKWGTGGLNIDACRIPGAKPATTRGAGGRHGRYGPLEAQGRIEDDGKGRFPANVVHDGSPDVLDHFPDTKSGLLQTHHKLNESDNRAMSGKNYARSPKQDSFGDEGSAGRFFYEVKPDPPGRFPANVLHDGSPDVVDGFPDARSSGGGGHSTGERGGRGDIWGRTKLGHDGSAGQYHDGGSASRFFYTPKADDHDRMTSDHPTVKPVDLMQYFCRVATPPGGLILDPFAGTGTTGEAAWREGFRCILIEKEPKYQEHIRTRMAMAVASARTRKTAVVNAKVKAGRKQAADLPLFGEVAIAKKDSPVLGESVI